MIRAIACILFVLGTATARTQPAALAPDFKEVYDLVRAHVSGLSETELNRMAVDGFIAALRPRVALIGGSTNVNESSEAPILSKALLMDGPIAYLRVAKTDASLPQAVREACRLMSATNKLNGVVLDVRYCAGNEYAAAAKTVDLFLKQERKLLDWGDGVVSSKEKSDALALPVAILVNHETIGAPEALAAALRETGTGLILGSPTAGQATIFQEYPLRNGDRLRIATSPVRLGDGSPLSPAGVKPDIAVDVSPQDERAYFLDGFKEIASANLPSGSRVSPGTQASSTNRVRRPKFNEAELVRERKEGFIGDVETATGDTGLDEKPTVHDPALARALDVLKGLALVRAAHRS
jgi:hypothetical protein